MKSKLIYRFEEYGLYYEPEIDYGTKDVITLSIDTLQIDFDQLSGNILSLYGFLPLVKARKINIKMPLCIEGQFSIPLQSFRKKAGIVYDYFCFFPESRVYFIKAGFPILSYDKKGKRILIGTWETNDRCIKVNDNITCGIDKKNNLKFIMVSPDIII